MARSESYRLHTQTRRSEDEQHVVRDGAEIEREPSDDPPVTQDDRSNRKKTYVLVGSCILQLPIWGEHLFFPPLLHHPYSLRC
jgi:hypothetical protein